MMETTDLAEAQPLTIDIEVSRDKPFAFQVTFATAVDARDVPTGTHNAAGWDISAEVRTYPNASALVELVVDRTDAASGVVRLRATRAVVAALPDCELFWHCRRGPWTLWAGTFTPGAAETKVVQP